MGRVRKIEQKIEDLINSIMIYYCSIKLFAFLIPEFVNCFPFALFIYCIGY